MNEAGSVKALLQLDASGFDNGIIKSVQKVTDFAKTMEKVGTDTSKFNDGITKVVTTLDELRTTLKQLDTISTFENFNRLSTAMKKLVDSAIKFNKEGSVTVNTFTQLGNGIRSFMNAIGGVDIKLTNVVKAEERVTATSKQLELALARVGANLGTGYQNYVSQINQVNDALMRMRATMGNGYGNYLSNINQVNNALNKTKTSSDSASTSTKNMSSSLNTASSSAATANQRFSGLHQTMGALRTMVSMVGSMFIYNFAHNMMISVQNTVKAKSEMESFLSTMGMTSGQVDSFNAVLDRTVERFQRVNKYNIGETVANIGLEFNLSAKEMEKAMSVTSMITSEYLRAGRNADEAALAVKDIMQGQFQRLSRETGVKQENLKEAGWSGDTSDVLGLMDALEKVAKARHWDTFAEKASSLNDIILITQNRLSEWATDMSEGVVPMVTDAFNFLVATVDGVTTIFSHIGESLNLPDWTGTALLITGVGLALTGLVTATINARTGLGLVDIAHKGLGQSIIATIFNIQAEELEYQKASSIALGRVLGLNSEVVARDGVKNAIKAQVGLEQAENLIKKESMGVTEKNIAVQQLENLCKERKISESEKAILMERLEASQSLSTFQAIMTKVLGLNAEIVSQQGLLVALGASKSARIADAIATEGEAVAEETLNKARLIGIATMGVYLAALVAIAAVAAVFLLPAIQQVQSMNENMKTFNSLVNDGDNMIKDARSTVQSYKDEVSRLEGELKNSNLTIEERKTKEYELAEANKHLNSSEAQLGNTISAVEQARSSVAKSQEARQKTAQKQYEDTIAVLRELGYSYEEAAQKASEYYDVLGVGTGVQRELANHEEWNRGRLYDKNKELEEKLKEQGYNPAEIERRVRENGKIIDAENKQYEKMLTSQSLGEYLEGYLGWEWQKGVESFTDFQNWWDSNDWFGRIFDDDKVDMIRDFSNSLSGGFSSIVDGFNSLKSLFDGFDIEGGIFDILNPLTSFTSWLDSIDVGKMFSDWMNSIEIPDFGEWISGLFSGGKGGTGVGIAKHIDASWMLDSLKQLLAPLGDGIRSLFENPLASLGLDESFSFWGLIDKIMGWDSPEGGFSPAWAKFEMFKQSVIDGFNGLISYLTQLPSQFLTYLSQATTYIINWGGQLVAQGISVGSNFLNNLIQFFSQIPSRIQNYLSVTLSHIISIGSQWVSTARSKAQEIVNNVVSLVSQLPDKVHNEFMKIAQRIRDAISGAVQAATSFGGAIKDAVLGALRIFSPGIVQEKIAKEFADIPSRISEQNANAETQADSFGQSIVQGMNNQLPILQQQAQAISEAMSVSADSQALDFSGQLVGDYQADANVISGLNQTMTNDTATTFGLMGETVNTTIDGMSVNLQNSYLNMNTAQSTALTTMQNDNTNAFNKLQSTTTTSLNNMRTTTQNVTLQMVNAWDHMKDNIIASANQLKTQSTAHFNTLSDHIGTFYRKLQNPSMWGAGDKVPTRYYNSARGNRGRTAVRRAFGVSGPRKGYAGGYNPDNLPQTASIRKIRQIVGYLPIFNGMDLDQEVNVAQFLSMLGGSFGWDDWHPTHFNKIKTTSGEWKMKGPQIMHRIDTGETFQVKEFYNSQPQISFGSFQHMAEALFSAIPYDFYWNSDKYGSWVNALQAGACNCWDGAHALVALASTCGFSGHIEHGTWNGIGHVYAVINGKKMDTTGWQQRRDWNGVSAGSPTNSGFGNKTINVNIDMTGSTFNGESDFEDKMRDVAQRVMREEVNASITVGI